MFIKGKKLVFVLLLTLAALCASAFAAAAAEPLKIITTNFPGYDFVRAVGGDLVTVKMLLPPGAESHSFEPTPRDIIEIHQADLFVTVGGENERWIQRILESFGDDAPETVYMIEMVDAVPEEIVEGMQVSHDHDHDHADEAHDDHDHDHADEAHDDHDHDHADETHDDHDHDHADEAHDDHDHDHADEAHDDHDHDHEEPELDEHVWTDPQNAATIVGVIAAKLSELDPDNAAAYAANAAAYQAKFTELDEEYKAMVNGAARKTIVLGDRFPLRYLAKAYDLDYFAAFNGCSTETEASAGTIAFLIDAVKAQEIPVIFYIEFSNQKIANAIAEATGAVTREIHSGHNVSKADFDAGVTLYDLMKKNLSVLKEALYN